MTYLVGMFYRKVKKKEKQQELKDSSVIIAT